MQTSSHSNACSALLATFSNPPPFIPQKVLENRVLFCTKTEVENRIHGNSASGILVLVLVPVNNDDVGLAV